MNELLWGDESSSRFSLYVRVSKGPLEEEPTSTGAVVSGAGTCLVTVTTYIAERALASSGVTVMVMAFGPVTRVTWWPSTLVSTSSGNTFTVENASVGVAMTVV